MFTLGTFGFIKTSSGAISLVVTRLCGCCHPNVCTKQVNRDCWKDSFWLVSKRWCSSIHISMPKHGPNGSKWSKTEHNVSRCDHKNDRMLTHMFFPKSGTTLRYRQQKRVFLQQISICVNDRNSCQCFDSYTYKFFMMFYEQILEKHVQMFWQGYLISDNHSII